MGFWILHTEQRCLWAKDACKISERVSLPCEWMKGDVTAWFYESVALQLLLCSTSQCFDGLTNRSSDQVAGGPSGGWAWGDLDRGAEGVVCDPHSKGDFIFVWECGSWRGFSILNRGVHMRAILCVAAFFFCLNSFFRAKSKDLPKCFSVLAPSPYKQKR